MPDSTAGKGSDRLHVGIIMDGNGRWAVHRGLPRAAGHRAGAAAVRRAVAAAPKFGIGVLTLYAFSADNWQRPAPEVRHLMRLLRAHLRSEADRCAEEGVRVSVIGRRDRLPAGLVAEIESAEARTRGGRTLHLQVAIDYSSRDAIVSAARLAETGETINDRERFRHLISRALHADSSIPDADLIIRTGGEQRLSDFLLWESAYAELVFLPCLWPDFDQARLASAMECFSRRQRRYGGL
ncbi:MAG: di-trans,poly-cis-decaprenylcistransferase [Wenzhouxiangellaceae bacterium]